MSARYGRTQAPSKRSMPDAATARPRKTLAPYGRSWVPVLAGHLVFTFLHYCLFANTMWLFPMLVRLRFGSANVDVRDWQTTLITAAIPTFLLFAVFWGELLRRISVRKYLLLFWLVCVLPIGCAGLAQNYWQLLACHVVASAGFAGWAPVNGKLLKHFYADTMHGRIYGILSFTAHATGFASVYVVGRWIDEDPDAFRIFLPAGAVMQLCGLLLLMSLTRWTGMVVRARRKRRRPWRRLIWPILNMGKVLRADRTFLRYEVAFMTYGAAFMFCEALLPVLATTRLGMGYEDYSHSTQMATKLAQMAMVVPAGLLLDRAGPMRTSAIAFTVLALFPLLLLAATGPWGVYFACIAWGLGLSGVMMGWMLGPVTLAPRPDKVPQYVAIHATLVGVRGIFFQGFGMLLYKLTDTFVVPLGLAAVGFVAAAVQMVLLYRARRGAGQR